MNEKKDFIISCVANDNLDDLYAVVEQYLEEYPYDVDVMMIKGYLNLLADFIDDAIAIFDVCHIKNPFDVDVYYLLGVAYKNKKMYIKALNYLYHAQYIQMFYKQQYLFFHEEVNQTNIEELENLVVTYAQECKGKQLEELQKDLNCFIYKNSKKFWLVADLIRSKEKVIGDKLWINPDDMRYCGYYNAECALFEEEALNTANLCDNRGEVLPVAFEGTGCQFQLEKESIVPIASESEAIIQIECDAGEARVNHWIPKNFNYYKLDGTVKLLSNKKMYVAPPIPLGHDQKRKKLVISLFVDGLAQEVIDEVGLEKMMPYTYLFFKEGLIFKNAFTTSDWTYPSLASYYTGLEVPDHLMIKPDLAIGLPECSKTIFEYMKEVGYYTAMLTGDWRSPVTDGYGKGVDRYVVQHQNIGMRTEDVVMAAINHIAGFADTDQYLWITSGDLHDVADGFDMPLSMQTKMPLAERQMEEIGETSVKQRYSITKKQKYIRYAKEVDRYLHILYDYIETNYAYEDVVVTLFGDHGQKYLTKPGDHHLSRSHSNVAFMVRGCEQSGVSKDYISAVDYPAIMCELANAKYDPEKSVGIVPKALGGTEDRDFVVTETIHQNDPYMAAIRNEQYTFYFTSEHKLDVFGRLQWGGYTCKLETADGQEVENQELVQTYVEWIKHHLRYIISY